MPAPGTGVDDTLQLYFLCAHPSLTPSSAVALTLRAVGGLTTRQIAQAYLVPEATMAQRITRAKRTVTGVRFDQPGDVATVLRVLYLVFNEGYSGDVDLAAEAIRLTRQLAAVIDHPEVAGLLALMLLHHARRAARTAPDGSLVPLAEQDRGRWDTTAIAEGVEILQAALARDRLGEFQAQAAIAALHADALHRRGDRLGADRRAVRRARAPDRQPDRPAQPRRGRRRSRRTARGPGGTGRPVDDALPRHTAVAAYLHERDGDLVRAARLYVEAAHQAPNLAERAHLTRQAARLNARRDRPRVRALPGSSSTRTSPSAATCTSRHSAPTRSPRSEKAPSRVLVRAGWVTVPAGTSTRRPVIATRAASGAAADQAWGRQAAG